MTAAEPAVKTATAYYEANIGSVTVGPVTLVGNYRLLSYALNAYGLGGQINAKGLITKVLEGGVSNPKSLANTLPNSQWKAFAAAFNFVDSRRNVLDLIDAVRLTTTASDYVEQQLESDQGAQQDVGVELALYFQRVAPTVTSEYRNSGRSKSSASGGNDHGALAGRPARSDITSAQTLSSSCRSPTCRTRPSSSSSPSGSPQCTT